MQPPDERTGERGAGGFAERTEGGGAGATGTVRRVVDLFREEDAPFDAASIAYYAIASFLPLLIVATAVLSLVGATDAFVSFLRGSLSGGALEVVESALTTTQGRSGAGAIGFLVALWGATRVFRGLSKAFADLYGRDLDESILDQVGEALVVLALLLFAFVVVSAAAGLAAAVPPWVPFSGVLISLAGLALLVLGLLPMYYVLPPMDVTLGHAVPGAVVAAIGWVVLQALFSVYARYAGTYDAYGYLGAVLLFVVFLYFAATVVLAGAAVNVVLDR